ncbi:MAG TPA: LysR family transcriptional regulator [Terriglobales bacterium]
MELRQIRHFIAVAETGSFTKAAQRTSVSQPALSASVAKLEAEYQVKLLDRRRSRVVPTAAGQRLLERAAAILLACNSVRAQVRSTGGSRAMRIGVLRTFATQPVCRLIKIFSRMRPDATFELCDGTKDSLLAKLNDHQLDAVIGRIDAPDPRFSSSILFKEKFILAVASNHRFARENAVKLGDIDGEPFVARTGCEIYEKTTKMLADMEINLRYAYKTDQDYRALSLVSAGVGIAIIPELFDAAGIFKVDISDFDFSRNMGVYWNSDSESEHLEKFLLVASSHDWRSTAH